jgi:histidinol phosphatase-like PHP family hydrolase
MTWSPLDCHAHSTWSDGDLTPAEVAETVTARGARPSISDHLSRDVPSAVKSVEEIRRYLDDLDRHLVYRGGEFCWHDSLWRELPDEVAVRFTHRIGSLHAVFLPNGTKLHAFDRQWPDGLAHAAYMEIHLQNLERLAREMPIDILAHPTLLPLALRPLPPEELWTEALEERMVEALHGARIAFELSARYRPHDRLVRRAADHGLRFSLGSDGHSAEQVGNLAIPLATARALGVNDADLYDPLVHGSRVPSEQGPSAIAS